MKTPRAYQTELEEKLAKAWVSGAKHLLLQLPTGGGKSLTMGLLARKAYDKGFPVLHLAHREELIHQASTVFTEDVGIPERDTGLILAGYAENRRAPVQIGSIQTFSKRMAVYMPEARLIFIDEAHRSMGEQYKALRERYPKATFIGATATPLRLDGQPLRDYYDAMVCGPSAYELMTMGFLGDPRVVDAPVDMRAIEGMKRDADGDFAEKDQEKLFLSKEIMGEIVPHYERFGGGHRAFVFACSVAHAEMLKKAFQARGHRAEVLTGKTPRTDRKRFLEQIGLGEIRILISVGVLLEGVDCPPVKVIIWARATDSLTVYLQGTGRGLRPWNNVRPVIIDHAGNVARLGMPLMKHKWSLEAAPVRPKTGMVMTKKCESCEEIVAVGCRQCPSCGIQMVAPAGPPVEAQVELRERTVVDELREAFERHWAVAKKKGFKPGYVFYAFYKETGQNAPTEWMNIVNADCAKDEKWKKTMGIKYVMKKKMAEAKARIGGR